MKILVTGGAGFIGSNYCRQVLENHPEDEVVVLDALTYAGNLSTLEDLQSNPRFRFYHGRIEDRELVMRILQKEKIDAVVNFAAETHNDRSLLGAERFLVSNVIGVYVLLECVRRLKVSRMVHVSTDEVYGSVEQGEAGEDAPLKPNTPYSASKAAADLLCRAHFVSYGTPVIITRGGNTYGPYQYPEKLISFFTVRLILGKKVPLYGEGQQIREWIHVRDHCTAIDLVLRAGVPGEVYNISSNDERPNREVTQRLLALTGRGEEYLKFIPDPRGLAHDFRYSMSSEKIRKMGWAPRVPFEEGLEETVRWYQSHERWWREILAKQEYRDFLEAFYQPWLGEDL
ncbi:MAG: dTDP-glucose 4,6-dehydratase [Fimbriimonadales bacterium]|nr:dTDP-glucose 4,6-dehydratase [Fimbriimonadales bacterium]